MQPDYEFQNENEIRYQHFELELFVGNSYPGANFIIESPLSYEEGEV